MGNYFSRKSTGPSRQEIVILQHSSPQPPPPPFTTTDWEKIYDTSLAAYPTLTKSDLNVLLTFGAENFSQTLVYWNSWLREAVAKQPNAECRLESIFIAKIYESVPAQYEFGYVFTPVISGYNRV